MMRATAGALFTPLLIERLGPVAAMMTSVTTYVAFAGANLLLECGPARRGRPTWRPPPSPCS